MTHHRSPLVLVIAGVVVLAMALLMIVRPQIITKFLSRRGSHNATEPPDRSLIARIRRVGGVTALLEIGVVILGPARL